MNTWKEAHIMARNKSSKFGADAGLFEVPQVHEVHEVHEAKQNTITQSAEIASGKKIGETQGKKGQKLKRINMAFSDENHTYITLESRKEGLSATAFVNKIIDEYRKKR